MVRLKGSWRVRAAFCIAVSIPHGSIKSYCRRRDSPRYPGVSIPHGSIKSVLSFLKVFIDWYVSIPHGSIKRGCPDGENVIAAVFQFHMVRLKEITREFSDGTQTSFQFHMVRLKGHQGRHHRHRQRSFNSTWFD